MSEVSALWQRIESGLKRLGDTRQLRPPASEAAIAAAEAQLGVPFPADLCESLLRHDGVMPDAWPDFFYPMQVANIVQQSQWHDGLKKDGRLHFLLVADGGDGSNLALRLDPGVDGPAGELLFFEGKLEGNYYPSWAAFLENTAQGLESGRYVLSDEEYQITELGNGSWVVQGDNPVAYRSLVEVEA